MALLTQTRLPLHSSEKKKGLPLGNWPPLFVSHGLVHLATFPLQYIVLQGPSAPMTLRTWGSSFLRCPRHVKHFISKTKAPEEDQQDSKEGTKEMQSTSWAGLVADHTGDSSWQNHSRIHAKILMLLLCDSHMTPSSSVTRSPKGR